MAYDPDLADRMRHALTPVPGVSERKMFGGLAFLIRGHMTVVASSRGGLMVRSDPKAAAELVDTSPAEYAEMRGRQMRGWLHLDAADVRSDADLARWIDHAVVCSSTLPPKV